jgi:hypothetical protein
MRRTYARVHWQARDVLEAVRRFNKRLARERPEAAY